MSLNYELKELRLDDITSKNSKIKIPQFQRGLVWSLPKQKDFIKTMREGDPFGAILLSKDDESDDYHLIDGLQRVSTIKRFYNNPNEFIDVDWINKKLFSKLIDLFIVSKRMPEAGKDKYIENLKKIILETFSKHRESSIEMASEISEVYEISNDYIREFYKIIDEIHKNISNQIKLNSALIPAIIYTGNKEKLPTVFSRMNQGAVTLSKYEVLASTWYPYEISINDSEISKYIKDKYKKIRDESELEVNFDIDELDNKINVFEYCYAIGDMLKDKKSNDFYSIFGEKSKSMSTDSLGFDIITLLLGNKINEVDNIKDFIYNAPNYNEKFLTEFKESLKDTAQVLFKILGKWINITNNPKLYYKVISGYQALHMFISMHKVLYVFDKENYTIKKDINRRVYNDYKKYLPLHLFYDVVSDYWSLNRQVSDLHENIKNENLLFKYKNNISISDLIIAVDNYVEKGNSSFRKTISSETKFILDFLHKINLETNQLYREKFSVENRKFDFDHIVPRQRVNDIVDDIPISSIANLCIMIDKENRSKQNLTLYEDEGTRASYDLSEDILNLMIYPVKSELNFLDYSSDQKKEEYFKFVNNRKNTLTSVVTDKVSNYFNNNY